MAYTLINSSFSLTILISLTCSIFVTSSLGDQFLTNLEKPHGTRDLTNSRQVLLGDESVKHYSGRLHPYRPYFQRLIHPWEAGSINKRFMGIFRCYGWGPGCTSSIKSEARGVGVRKSESQESRARMDTARLDEKGTSSSYQKLIQKENKMDDRKAVTAVNIPEDLSLPVSSVEYDDSEGILEGMNERIREGIHEGIREGMNEGVRERMNERERVREKWEQSQRDREETDEKRLGSDFGQPKKAYTFTSGNSWMPKGYRRERARRYTTTEKQDDFLRQILRDMIVEMASEKEEDR